MKSEAPSVDKPYGKLRLILVKRTTGQETQRTCLGMTAVIRRAEAVLQALIMMRSSIRPSLMSPGAVLCRMKTGRIRHKLVRRKRGHEAYHLRLEHWRPELAFGFFVQSYLDSLQLLPLADCNRSLIVRVLQDEYLGLEAISSFLISLAPGAVSYQFDLKPMAMISICLDLHLE